MERWRDLEELSYCLFGVSILCISQFVYEVSDMTWNPNHGDRMSLREAICGCGFPWLYYLVAGKSLGYWLEY